MGDYSRDRDATHSPISTVNGPEAVSDPGTTDATHGEGEIVGQADIGLQISKEQIYEDLASKQNPLEEYELILHQFEKTADGKVRASYFNGIRAQEVTEGAVEPKVGITFMAGADTPQVNRMEQIGMTQGVPDQKSATWRVNTAGTLLKTFDVDKDLSIIQIDNTLAVVAKARERYTSDNTHHHDSRRSSKALASLRREDRTVTIDSDKVKIVSDLSTGRWDLESTLIEVDGPSLLALTVNYRHLISRSASVLTFEDTVQLLDVMIEDARRLCVRSPILFRMSTRQHIISSKNTRYGVDNGTMFRTLTTSRGIRNIIELSASYFNSLASPDKKDKSQELIRPRFLQMLVLLLSLLNDDDLRDIAKFLEDTYLIRAERRHIELLILKVLPLMSINPSIFVKAMLAAVDGPGMDFDHRESAAIWSSFIHRLLSSGYMLPGTVSQLGQRDYSWVIVWDDAGFKDTHIFNHLQYAGKAKTVNDIPPLDLNPTNGTKELTVVLHNMGKYIIGTSDLEKVTCMTRGRYSIMESEGGRTFDLEVTEEVVNRVLYEAIRQMNNIIHQLNSHLASPRRKTVLARMTSLRISGERSREPTSFDEIKGSGRLTLHWARLNEQYLAVAYKVEGRKITRRDLSRNLASDLGKMNATMHLLESTMLELDSRGISGEIRQSIHTLRQRLAEIRMQVAQAEQGKARLDRHVVDLPDEPISKVLYPSGAERSTNPVWHDYAAWYVQAEYCLTMEAPRRVVESLKWISDDIIELGFRGVLLKYFVSPLEPVSERERPDEVQEHDQAMLVGQYVVILESGDPGYHILTNWLKVTGVGECTTRRRGMNRRNAEVPWRAAIR